MDILKVQTMSWSLLDDLFKTLEWPTSLGSFLQVLEASRRLWNILGRSFAGFLAVLARKVYKAVLKIYRFFFQRLQSGERQYAHVSDTRVQRDAQAS